jgi:tellurite methyltransferase
VAVDGSPAAIARVEQAARAEGLDVSAQLVDATDWEPTQSYPTITCIGLLMFLARDRSLRLLRSIQAHVEPGGCAVVNVLIEGTTFMDMFDPRSHYLYGWDELEACFAGWTIVSSLHESFPAPGHTRKEFSTVIAEKPAR